MLNHNILNLPHRFNSRWLLKADVCRTKTQSSEAIPVYYGKPFCQIQTARSSGWGPCPSLPSKACGSIFTWWNNELSLSSLISLCYLTGWHCEMSPGLQMSILFIYPFFLSFHSSINNYTFLIISFGLNLCCTLCGALAHLQRFRWLWQEESGIFTPLAAPTSAFHPHHPVFFLHANQFWTTFPHSSLNSNTSLCHPPPGCASAGCNSLLLEHVKKPSR